MKHLYVHIPFCRSRCAYCDFASEPIGRHLRAGRVAVYLEALRAELRERGQGLEYPLDTIYLGGGTPTALPRHDLLQLVVELAALQKAPSEFTVEANPGTVDAALLSELQGAGVTRLSLGVQSFSPALRSALGRRVTQRELEATLAAVQACGWEEWNVDLIFGIPGQSWKDAAGDIDAAVAAGPTHISLYDLTFTPSYAARMSCNLGSAARRHVGTFAEEHLAKAVERLEAAGYRRYEVSNFALPGHECRHNLAYWRGEEYLGIGASAVSTVAVAPAGAERRTNPRTVAAYLAGDTPEIEQIDAFTALWERAMLGLRTAEGVEESLVLPVLDPDRLEMLTKQGCLQKRCGKLRLNPGFMDVCNSVLATLLLTPDGG